MYLVLPASAIDKEVRYSQSELSTEIQMSTVIRVHGMSSNACTPLLPISNSFITVTNGLLFRSAKDECLNGHIVTKPRCQQFTDITIPPTAASVCQS